MIREFISVSLVIREFISVLSLDGVIREFIPVSPTRIDLLGRSILAFPYPVLCLSVILILITSSFLIIIMNTV